MLPSRLQSYHSPFGQSSLGADVQSSNELIPLSKGTLDLGPLKISVLQKIDPDKILCKFEIPGGGTCLDPKCGDTHLRDLEPSGKIS
jgi:hypothetical protein